MNHSNFFLVLVFLFAFSWVQSTDVHNIFASNSWEIPVDTTLEKKCNYLKSKTTSSYVGNSCFVTTTEKYATTLENWHKLHEHCKALAGYSGRMAFIRTREQIDALLKDRVIEVRFVKKYSRNKEMHKFNKNFKWIFSYLSFN